MPYTTEPPRQILRCHIIASERRQKKVNPKPSEQTRQLFSGETVSGIPRIQNRTGGQCESVNQPGTAIVDKGAAMNMVNGPQLPQHPTLTNNKIAKLNGKNYQSWRAMISIFLDLKGLKDVVFGDGTEGKTRIMDLQAKSVIFETMDERHANAYANYPTAREIMDRFQCKNIDQVMRFTDETLWESLKEALSVFRPLADCTGQAEREDGSLGKFSGRY